MTQNEAIEQAVDEALGLSLTAGIEAFTLAAYGKRLNFERFFAGEKAIPDKGWQSGQGRG